MKGRIEIIGKPRTGMIKLGKMLAPINHNFSGFVYENRGGLLRIGTGEFERGGAISIQENASLDIGNHFRLTSGCRIICAKKIKIGDYSRIGYDTLIMDTDWHALYEINTHQFLPKTSEIHIGNHVWIANGVSVMKSSRIPNYSVIAAKSLVNRKLDMECSLYSGIPAKFMKQIPSKMNS